MYRTPTYVCMHMYIILMYLYTDYMPMCVYGMYVCTYSMWHVCTVCMYMYVHICMYAHHTDLSRHLVSDFSAIQDLMAVGNTHR